MQRFKNVSAHWVDSLVKQENGVCADIVDGVLLENVVYSFDFGTLFCFETYVNSWTSAYDVLFFHKDRQRGIGKAWNQFYSLRA